MVRSGVFILLLLLAGGVDASRHTITSLPYTASRDYDTLTLGTARLLGSGDGITITGHHVFLDLEGDTLIFGAGNGNYNQGITISGGAHHVTISGGVVYHGGNGDNNSCLHLSRVNDITIRNTDMVVRGTNGHCVTSASVGYPGNYNVEIDGGGFWNNCHGYTSRCMYDGSAMRLWSASYGGIGNYHYKIHDITIHQTPGQGIMIAGRDQGTNEAVALIYNNTIYGDARNSFYDDCGPGGCGVCYSSANPYAIAFLKCGAGTKCFNNSILSGDHYGGSRGILVENSNGSFENPIEIYNNYIDISEGPNAERPDGIMHAIRIRSIDGGYHGHIYIHHNNIVGTVDNNAATTHIGREVRLLFHSVQPGDVGYVVIESNRLTAQSLTSNTDCKALVIERTSSASGVPGNEYRFNRIESSGTIVKLGDVNMAASDIILEGDTLVFLSTSAGDRMTWNIGRYQGQSINNRARDCVFLGGARDTNIVWTHCQNGDNRFALEKVFNIMVRGNNNLPVPGASVTVTNNYGRVVLSGSTSNYGYIRQPVTYWYEAEDTRDSTNFGPFRIQAAKGSDVSQIYFSVSDDPADVVVGLDDTPGENCDDCDFICGDANQDSIINLLDIAHLIEYLYKGGPAPESMAGSDVNNDGLVDIKDIVYLRAYLYTNGPLPDCPGSW